MSDAALDALPLMRHRLRSAHVRRGVAAALVSGAVYGLYSAFVTKAMGTGVWATWYAGPLTGTMILLLGAMASAINDTVSACWAVLIAAVKGKLGDLVRCLPTKPGAVMMACALIGGPIASTAYIVALRMAGSLIIPIAALCPAIGAVLGRLLFKQQLNARMLVGVFVCVGASILIGSQSLGDGPGGSAFIGCLIALVAAFGWGLEGCIAGVGTSLIDNEIAVAIRQTTSGLTNLLILVPVLAAASGGVAQAPRLVGQAISDGPAMLFFAVSGLFALFTFGLWYMGNARCGAALGMACNGTYSFWGPFFCWIVLGVVFGGAGWALAPVVWLGAVVMAVGILLIAVDPVAWLTNKAAA